jgi:hypothetical protein
MSGALIKEGLAKIVDPRVNLDKKINYVIEDGGVTVSYNQSYTDAAGGNSSSFTFSNADPPGPGVIIDKKVVMKVTFRLTFTGTPVLGQRLIGYVPSKDPANPIYNKSLVDAANYAGTSDIRATGTDGPRCFPLAQIMNSLSITINNASVQQPVSDYIEPLMRYSSGRDTDETAFSMTCAQPDQYQDYADFVTYGSARNVLGNYGEQGYYTNRGGFSGVRWVRNPIGDGVNPVTAIFELTVAEPLFISPLDFGAPHHNERGLIGVQNFTVTVNTTGDLSRVWSHDSTLGQPISSVSCIISSANQTLSKPELQFTYITPRLLSNIPEYNVYPYYEIDRFVTEFPGSAVAPAFPNTFIDAPETQLQSNSRNLSAVPKFIYIYVRESNATRDYTDTDTYAFIRRISIDFDNQTNLLASCSPYQLYTMSAKNGCELSWSQWTKFVGSVICVNVAEDLNLREDLVAGIRDNNLNFRVRADIVNIGSQPRQYSLYVLPSYPGVFNISMNAQAIAQVGIIEKKDILAVSEVRSLDYYSAHNYYGGKQDFRGRLGEIGKVMKSAYKVGAPVLKAAYPQYAPLLSGLEELVAKYMAAGYSKKDAKRMAGVRAGVKAGVKAGSLVGGKKMTKKQMQRLL